MATQKATITVMKKDITVLKRENTRLTNANVKLNDTINKLTEEAGAEAETMVQRDNYRAEVIDLKHAKNKLVEEKTSLERTVSSLSQETSNHENLLRDLQRDIRTCCELMYGNDFDPEWRGDRPMHIYQDGQEYAPVTNGEVASVGGGYMEPTQRLMRMLWRRTHWGLNPLILRDHSRL